MHILYMTFNKSHNTLWNDSSNEPVHQIKLRKLTTDNTVWDIWMTLAIWTTASTLYIMIVSRFWRNEYLLFEFRPLIPAFMANILESPKHYLVCRSSNYLFYQLFLFEVLYFAFCKLVLIFQVALWIQIVNISAFGNVMSFLSLSIILSSQFFFLLSFCSSALPRK